MRICQLLSLISYPRLDIRRSVIKIRSVYSARFDFDTTEIEIPMSCSNLEGLVSRLDSRCNRFEEPIDALVKPLQIARKLSESEGSISWICEYDVLQR